jgi:hypothetical protein
LDVGLFLLCEGVLQLPQLLCVLCGRLCHGLVLRLQFLLEAEHLEVDVEVGEVGGVGCFEEVAQDVVVVEFAFEFVL